VTTEIPFSSLPVDQSDVRYLYGPDSTAQQGVPSGTVTTFEWNQSSVYPVTSRKFWVYVPDQYDPSEPASLMVFQDGEGYLDPRDEVRAAVVLDNLIHRGEVPVTIGVFVDPGVFDGVADAGRGKNRNAEYDAFDDRYGRIVIRLRPDITRQVTARVMSAPMTLERTVGRTPVNAQLVKVTPAQGEPFDVLVEVDDPSSPIHKDRIGVRMAPTISSDSIPDPATARAVGAAQLAEYAMAQDTVTTTQHPEHLDLDEGDVVERVEPISGTAGRWVIDRITYPVCLGTLDTSEVSVGVLFLEDVAA
jgi:hypothetical protein